MKYLKPLNKEKGVAGIEVLIEIVIGLFILGVLVFCITLMGSEIMDQDSLYNSITGTLTNATTTTVINETQGVIYPTGVRPGTRNCALTVTYATNSTGSSFYNATGVIASTNYTVSNCYIYFSSVSDTDNSYYNNTLWNISGSWSYDRADSAVTINDTYQSIGEVVDWFPIIIIFGAIVVLILLTVLIIRTVRGTGYGGSGFGRETA